MTCEKCGGVTTVTASVPDIDSVYRRRKCVKCQHKFITVEMQSYDDKDKSTLYELMNRRRRKGGEKLQNR